MENVSRRKRVKGRQRLGYARVGMIFGVVRLHDKYVRLLFFSILHPLPSPLEFSNVGERGERGGFFFSFFFLFRIFFIVKYFMMAACGVWFGCRKCVQSDNVYAWEKTGIPRWRNFAGDWGVE